MIFFNVKGSVNHFLEKIIIFVLKGNEREVFKGRVQKNVFET
jgi:hypothetical protein